MLLTPKVGVSTLVSFLTQYGTNKLVFPLVTIPLMLSPLCYDNLVVHSLSVIPNTCYITFVFDITMYRVSRLCACILCSSYSCHYHCCPTYRLLLTELCTCYIDSVAFFFICGSRTPHRSKKLHHEPVF